MPYTYVEPDIYLSHQGVDVFYTYREGELSRREYWFTTDPTSADDFRGHGKRGQFDVRRFARIANPENWAAWERWWKPRFRKEADAIRALICVEIEAGRLPQIVEMREGALA